MKNSDMIASWDKVLPGDDANERMLSAILKANRLTHNGKEKVSAMSKAKIKKWIPVAACLALFIAIGVIVGPGLIKREKTWPQKHVAQIASSRDEVSVRITKDTWANTGNAGRYTTLRYSGVDYITAALALKDEDKGSSLGNAVVTGQDRFSGEIHEMDVEVFEIQGVDSKCAVAVRFTEPDSSVNGMDHVYAYMNTDYSPGTLGELIRDLGLEKQLEIGLVSYKYRQGEDMVVFEDVDVSKVLELLKTNESVANVSVPDTDRGRTVISIGADYLGIGMNKGIFLTEEGYLWTNILETGKYFYIGKDEVDEFVNYVIDNCDGYIYIYDLTQTENAVDE